MIPVFISVLLKNLIRIRNLTQAKKIAVDKNGNKRIVNAILQKRSAKRKINYLKKEKKAKYGIYKVSDDMINFYLN